MRTIKISDELVELLKALKEANARKTGHFKSYNQIMLDALPSPAEYEEDDENEDGGDDYT